MKHYVAVIIGALLLMIPAFYNGYPIANPDTNTYMLSGFKLETPFDRPIMYGLSLRLFSLNGLSLWGVVFFQAVIVSWLLFRLVKHYSSNEHYLRHFLFIVFVLSVFTGLSWVTSELIADIYAGICALCIMVLLTGKEEKRTKLFLYVLYFLSVATHFSHVLIFSLVLVLLLLLHNYVFDNAAQTKTVRVLLVLTVATILTMGSAFSKSKHVFFTASLLDKGILKEYLDEHCGEKNYKLCKYKDSLPVVDVFLWDEKSPLYKEGGWQQNRAEYKAIVNDIMSSPKYLLLFAKQSVVYTTRQLIFFIIGEGNINVSNVYEGVKKYFPHEFKAFDTSKQNEWALVDQLPIVNIFFNTVIFLSVVMLLVLLVIKQKVLTKQVVSLLAIIVIILVVNAWDCATFSAVVGRYQCRVVWLLPFWVMLALLNYPLRTRKGQYR